MESDERQDLLPVWRRRIADQIRDVVARLKLDLAGLQVLTEAATGAYTVTPVIAALAGAEVVAYTKASRHGTVEQVRRETLDLAEALGVAARIRIVQSLVEADIARADIVTNSGHLRPLDARMIDCMKPTAVIPLMYEAWEYRAGDLDLKACRRRGIRVGGTNERHPAIGVFDYLGPVVVKAVLAEGHPLLNERCLVISDNDFGGYVKRALESNGATVQVAARGADALREEWDIVVVAATPPLCGGQTVFLDGIDACLFCQLWGDVDRSRAAGVWSPRQEPPAGHMGLRLESLGPAPIIRLQAGGLKVGAVLQGRNALAPDDVEYCQLVQGA